MMNPQMYWIIMTMFMILMINHLTTKTSIMCLNMIMFTILSSMIMSMKMKLSPIPFIVFLTMIGGLMIIFLYLAATLWNKKENLTLKTKSIMIMMIVIPLTSSNNTSEMSLPNQINLFNPNLNKITNITIIILTMMLIFTIEIYMKTNSPFRRKLKIWEQKKNF